MKKMTTKGITGIVTAALVLGLAACGGSKAPASESQAQSQTEAEQTGESAVETQPAQTETEAPAGPSESEIANAYLQILRRDEARIRGYHWQEDWGQGIGKPVAITDVTGDEIPELVYAAVSDDADKAMYLANLYIYTYEADEKEAEELCDEENWDVAVAGGCRYLLFLEKDGSFWAYTSAGDDQWTNTFELFVQDGDDLEMTRQLKKFNYPDDDYSERITEYSGAGDSEISEAEYESRKAELEEGMALGILQGNLDDQNLEAAADRAGMAAMTYDEAVQYLQGMAGGSKSAEISADTLFASLDDLDFWFASGAGAWATELEIDEDGSFSGEYHDSDMGDRGDDYPGGTVYVCEFEGRFSKPEKIDDYSYRLKLEDISYEKKPGTTWIDDQVRKIASEAYGLTPDQGGMEGAAGSEFIFYLPGAPTADLPDGFIDSIRMPRAWSEVPAKLPCYGLYNVQAETAFSADAGTASGAADDSSSSAGSSDQGLLPESSQKLLTEEDIAGMSDDDIQLAINTIYARHGYQFKDSELLQYFKGFDWYQPTETDMEKVQNSFSEIEEKNVNFLARQQ